MSKKEDIKKMLALAMKLSPEGVKYILGHMETYALAQNIERERNRRMNEGARRGK